MKPAASNIPGQIPMWSYALLAIIALGIWTSLYFDSIIPALAIGGSLLLAILLVWPRLTYLAVAAAIPISTEVYLPGGLGTDLPSEPLMWLVVGLGALYFIANINKVQLKAIMHPSSLMLLIVFTWTLLTTFFSSQPLISLKYTIAKTWYIIPFFFMPLYLFRNRGYANNWIKVITGLTSLTLIIILFRQFLMGFGFSDVNKLLNPFYRNHVTYACMIGVVFPFILYFRRTAINVQWKRLLSVAVVIFLIGIFFSYTRAAIIAVMACLAWQIVVRFKLTRLAIIISLIGALSVGSYFFSQNRYLDYAPDYYRTITHKNFDDLLTATYKLEDISTMERVYRWVAGYHMMLDRPIMGFGPGSFYETYKKYTVNSFQTYVSDNPEKSGMHNYYFMLIVEQGWIGLLLWVIWIVYLLILGERLWHKTNGKEDKHLIIACLMTMVFVLMISLMNDMIETDKVGPIFFICASILTLLGIKKKLI